MSQIAMYASEAREDFDGLPSSDDRRRLRRRVPPPVPKPHVVSMGRYGSVADKAWFAKMSGRLWMLTEKEKRDIRKKG